MPNRDGNGPKTGRGLGNCSNGNTENTENDIKSAGFNPKGNGKAFRRKLAEVEHSNKKD